MKTKRKREGRKKIGREKERERGAGGQTDIHIKRERQVDRQTNKKK